MPIAAADKPIAAAPDAIRRNPAINGKFRRGTGLAVKRGMKKPQVFRVCAVCGRRHAATYGFRNALARYGIKGDKAAIECIKNLSKRGNVSKSNVDD